MSPPPDTPSQPTTAPAAQPTSDLPPPDTARAGAAAPLLPAHPGRYELGEEVGRGGMGAVLRARDPHLNRELAVKVLRGGGEPESLRRFVEEAQVCSQLQHPGIVPVHDLGRLEDGRPFFAMKLVQGRTLAELLRKRAQPADDLPRFLDIFGQVCQAVGYAHSRGVIHRDLKPSNVMVGAFGEVQVMDWGLAKVLRPHERGAAAFSAVRTVRSASGDESREGQAMGTPAYMAPEQARGEVDSLDERADVFGLGAILCEILTGRPPFAGGSREEVHARAMRADLGGALARLDGCGADAELVALAKGCLAPGPAARPRDGGAVAAAVTAYRNAVRERLRRSELGRARAQVLGAAALAAVVLAAGVGLWLQRLRGERQAEAVRQAEALRQEVGAALAQAVRFRRDGHFSEALASLGQARQRLGDGGPEGLRAQVDQAFADTELVRGLDEARQRFTARGVEWDFAGAAQAHAEALARSGLGREGEDAQAVAARVRASAVRDEVVAALDFWAGISGQGPRREWLLAVARAADPDPVRDRLRDPSLWSDPAALAREARAPELSARQTGALAWARAVRQADAVPLLREALARHPDDFWLNFQLGMALYQAKEWNEAVEYYRVALALRPRASFAHTNFGIALRAKGRLDEAMRHYEEALRLDGGNAYAHNSLGAALKLKGRTEEAVRHYEEALRLDPTLAEAHYNLGIVAKDKGRLDEAVRRWEEALRLNSRYTKAHVNLGIARHRQGRLDEAVGHFTQAIALDPTNARARSGLGNVLRAKGEVGEAVRRFEEAVRLDPKLAEAHGNLGQALLAQGRWAEARDATRRCLDLLPQGHPLRATAQRQLETCERLLSLAARLPAVLADQDRPADAAECLDFGRICHVTTRYAAAARFYADAFAASPPLADGLRTRHRYRAACCAALAAAGQGADTPKPDDKERARLRGQALGWLRADLALWRKLADSAKTESGATARQQLRHWQQDADLAGLRDPQALAALAADERAEWEKLWAEVADLLRRLDPDGAAAPPAGK